MLCRPCVLKTGPCVLSLQSFVQSAAAFLCGIALSFTHAAVPQAKHTIRWKLLKCLLHKKCTHTWTHTLAHTHTCTVLEMAQTSRGTRLATITPPEMNHLLLIPALSPPPADSSQLDFWISLFSNHFHKSLLIDPGAAAGSGVLLLFGFQAVAGFVPWLLTVWKGLWRWLIYT